MLELVVIIVIIGILAMISTPKYDKIIQLAEQEQEKISMNILNSLIISKTDKIKNFNWHNIQENNTTLIERTKKNGLYFYINKYHLIFSNIIKNNKYFKIQGVIAVKNGKIVGPNLKSNSSNDILLITGIASNPSTGVKQPLKKINKDIIEMPDKNDIWIFNPNNFDINITSKTISLNISSIVIFAESISLLDINGINKNNIKDLIISDSNQDNLINVTSIKN